MIANRYQAGARLSLRPNWARKLRKSAVSATWFQAMEMVSASLICGSAIMRREAGRAGAALAIAPGSVDTLERGISAYEKIKTRAASLVEQD